jgi:N-acyl-D-amino-acid deacylase
VPEFDVVIKGGTVIDGSGRPSVRADVGVRNGRIVEIGDVAADAHRVIDATGLAVTPGFVDLHTHLDVQLFWDRTLMISPWHGVTTVSMGNCGLGIAPTRPELRETVLRNMQHVEGMDFKCISAGMGDDWGFETFPEFMNAVDRRNLAINTVTQIGHVALKTYVLGADAADRVATADERARMVMLVDEALQSGAFGFSTDQTDPHFGEGGKPIASRLSSREEILELVAPLKKVPSGIFTLGFPTRADNYFTPEFYAQLATLLPHIHFHGYGPNVIGKTNSHRERIAFHERLRAHGASNHMQFCCLPMQFEATIIDPFFAFIDVPQQVDARPCNELLAPMMALESDAERIAALSADAFRERFREATSGPNWDRVFAIMSFSDIPGHPELDQRAVTEVSIERGQHPTDLLLDLQIEAYPDIVRFNIGYYNFDEEEVARVLQHPLVLPGNSDAGAHVAQLIDARWPTYLLSKYVRQRDALSLEWAIRKMSYEPARSLGISDRGLLAPGMWADIVILDPETVQDGPRVRRNDFPANGSHLVSEAIGIEHVIVNGEPIRERGHDIHEPDDPLPGRLLRNPVR